jgi:hypothetical protein
MRQSECFDLRMNRQCWSMRAALGVPKYEEVPRQR